jgi:hypothetical protein
VVLDLDEVVFPAKDLDIAGAGGVGFGFAAVHQMLADLGGEAAGETDETGGVLCEGREIGAGLVVETLKMGVGNEFKEILVADEVFGEDAEVEVVFTVLGFTGFFEAGAGCNVEFAANERLQVSGFGGVEKLDGSEHVAMVSEGDGGLAELGGALHQPIYLTGTIQEAVVRVDVEVDKIRGGDRHRGESKAARGSRQACCACKRVLTTLASGAETVR